MALRNVEMCVCDLAAFLGLTESAISHQLRRLKDLALVKSRREGQVIYYSLDDEHVAELLNIVPKLGQTVGTCTLAEPHLTPPSASYQAVLN